MTKPRPPTFEAVDLNALIKQTMDLERPQVLRGRNQARRGLPDRSAAA